MTKPLPVSLASVLLALLASCPAPAPTGDAGDAAAALDTSPPANDAGPTPSDASSDALSDDAAPPDATPSPSDAAADASTSTPRPLGSVTRMMEGVACGGNAPATAVCTRILVECPGIEPLDAVVAVTNPSGAARGTIFAHMGAGGTGFYPHNVDAYVAAGFRVAQVRWATDWEQTASAGILEAACRPATALRWVFDSVHRGSRAEAFCGVGHSGGSGALSFALAHYDGGAVLDFVALSAGPPFARIDYGCAPGTYTGPPRALCPELADAPIALPSNNMNTWENSRTCGAATPDPAEIATWAGDSVVQPSARYDYPQTGVTFWDCTVMPNGTTGGAYFYSQAIRSAHRVTCFTDCRGEDLGTAGWDSLRDAVLAECSPRHR